MKILIIEDNLELCEALSFKLKKLNFNIDTCNDGEIGLDLIRDRIHDIIILDRMLPSLDGIQILRRIRQEQINTPVIMLTALGEINDKILGLDCGADDYLTKPFDFEELVARINCIQRRPREINFTQDLTYKDIILKDNDRTINCKANTHSLSKKEYDLLKIFLKNPNQTFTRNSLILSVWGYSAEIEDGNLDNYIYFLRRRLKSVDSVLTIKTIRGLGYKLEEANA